MIEGYFDFPNFYTALANDAPANAQIVEVGVWKGASACFLGHALRRAQPHDKPTLWCVDTFRGSDEHSPADRAELARSYGAVWRTFCRNVANENLRDILVPVCLSSVEAAMLFEDASLDAVFIDAKHDYASAKTDISVWLPKVKPGGTIAGHDYAPSWGVKQAVDEAFGSRVQTSDNSVWFVHLCASPRSGSTPSHGTKRR